MQRQATGSSNRGAGTFPYISPEQHNTARQKKLDAKTDMYALGIILFELHYPRKMDDDEKEKVILITALLCMLYAVPPSSAH